jgi:hypothetical protein
MTGEWCWHKSFRHGPGTLCPSKSRESYEHEFLKEYTAQLIEHAGWSAQVEWRTPDGTRRADVLGVAPDESDSRAVEIQLSSQSLDHTIERTHDISRNLPANNTINAVCWLIKDLGSIGLSSGEDMHIVPWAQTSADRPNNSQTSPMIIGGVYRPIDGDLSNREPLQMKLGTFISRTTGAKGKNLLSWVKDYGWMPNGSWSHVPPKRFRGFGPSDDDWVTDKACPRVAVNQRRCHGCRNGIPYDDSDWCVSCYQTRRCIVCRKFYGSSEDLHMVMDHGAPNTWAKNQ